MHGDGRLAITYPFVFAEDDTQLAKLEEQQAKLPELVKIITFDGTADGDRVITMEALAELLAGRGVDYRHADEADFDRELDMERRLNEAVAQ